MAIRNRRDFYPYLRVLKLFIAIYNSIYGNINCDRKSPIMILSKYLYFKSIKWKSVLDRLFITPCLLMKKRRT